MLGWMKAPKSSIEQRLEELEKENQKLRWDQQTQAQEIERLQRERKKLQQEVERLEQARRASKRQAAPFSKVES